ncbi:MAG: hypothetical protein ACT4PW_08880 [Acidimicrobiia bacterium]
MILSACGLGQRGVRFGMREANAHESVRLQPVIPASLRTGLVDEQRDDGGGIEVGDQRRCSATRSDTVLLVFSGVGSDRGRVRAGLTLPFPDQTIDGALAAHREHLGERAQ